MMKKTINPLKISIIALVVFVFASCTKTENAFNIIPENAKAVVVFNGKSLSEKSGIKSFSQTKTFELIKKEVDEDEMDNFTMFEPVFNNTEESGLDFKNDFFFFTYNEANNKIFAFYVPVINRDKLEAMVEKIRESDNIEKGILKDGEYSYFQNEKDEPFVIWNDKKALFLMAMQHQKIDYLAIAKKLFNGKKEQSISSNKDFKSFAGKTKDISLWIDYSVFFDNLPPMQRMLLQSNMPYDMNETILHYYVDFQKGKVDFDYDVALNEDLTKLLSENNVIKENFDTGILDVLNDNPLLNMSFAINFNAYYKLLQNMMEENQQNTDMAEEQFKNQTGMTIEEALNELNGEMSLSLHRISLENVLKTDYSAYYKSGGNGNINDFKIKSLEPVYYYSAAVYLKSDKIFNMILQLLRDKVKVNNYYYYVFSDNKLYFGLFDNKMLFTNDSLLIADVSKDGIADKSLANGNIADELKDYPMYIFMNLGWSGYPEDLKEYVLNKIGPEKYNVFNNMISIYDKAEIKGKSETSASMILWLNDDSRNSLEVILSTFDNNMEALAD